MCNDVILYPSLSGCGAVGSALDWGSRGREFKSRHSDQIKQIAFRLSALFFYFVETEIRFIAENKFHRNERIVALLIK